MSMKDFNSKTPILYSKIILCKPILLSPPKPQIFLPLPIQKPLLLPYNKCNLIKIEFEKCSDNKYCSYEEYLKLKNEYNKCIKK